jgi:hypothetical protein
MTPNTNMPWAVYRSSKIILGVIPKDEVAISFHPSASDAMDEANRQARKDRAHSYCVGGA